ncbi:hypothetical protein [Novosphingobium jiangmenense]|uniref:DUF1475 domain-containing protein n=1 Tax=Novosphingobium jiangmenense TaxID=2791981 RepID=A0ABS0HJD1_9SPHN|nr:hypothetical protein [Novosphingobium jiangmenense]MBF9152344.1 hypothetical protein [Novosphingobium jiangmenense]
MVALRAFLLLWLSLMVAYTVMVVAGHGLDFLSPFSAAVARFGWEGQFSLDLAGFLILTAIWIAWRHGMSAIGVPIAVLMVSAGMIGVSLYLLLASVAARGDVKVLLLGAQTKGA